MAAVQMNVRLDSAVKAAGDSVIALSGHTPSQAVRALWEYLVIHRAFPSEIERMLRQDALGEDEACDSRGNVERAGVELISAFYETLGVPEPDDPVDYEELWDIAAEEELFERGLA